MSSPTQDDIRAELGVHPSAVPAQEARRRIDFLAQYLRQAGSKGYVLGISGGVDSLTVGRLCQLACEQLRADGYEARFVAMRLPYGQQADESDAQAALEFIQPDETLTVNIQGATDALWEACVAAGGVDATSPRADFDRGNVKARQRMVAQYAVAGSRSMLVVGTDHAAEAVVGFFTKFGDGACDLVPLAGLTKGQVRDVARHLGAPEPCVVKTPTADLETDKPLLADEAALGVTYDEIDAYLRGESVSEAAARTIESWHQRTGHKRALPVAPSAYVRQSLGKRV